ncbi:ABC-F family ATP-binding cassette domain-containing protein [Candidatus Omnitrophota bacterium]
MVFIKNLTKNFGKRVLFEDVTLNINRGEKIGLVGPNGAGKSTLFSFILGEAEPTSGSIQIMKGVHIGYLPQEAKFDSQRTVLEELTEGDSRIAKLKKEKEELEDKNQAGDMRYGDVLHELEVLGFFELEHKAKKILMGLGFKQRDFDRPIQNMSGGWQMRTLLAKLLTFQYDLLLLDEPTNYLDLNAALWLEDYLAKFRGTLVMISHDKAFLTDVTNYTLVLEFGRLYKVTGNYTHYEQIREERRKYLAKQSKEQVKKHKQLTKFVHRFHGQPNKAAQVRAKKRVLDNIEENEVMVPPDPRESMGDFQFPQTKKSGYKVITFNKVYKSYAEIKVYEELDLEINQGKKMVLVGENGAGKSTLLKMLAGVVEVDSGERNVGFHVDIGYFSQTRMDVLTEHNTVLEEAYTAVSGFRREEAVRTILGAFFFTGDDVEKKVSVLSGGEKGRLILAKLLINPPNFLLLDEPTTHLDVDAVEALVRALKSYQGTLIFISHDIYFVRSVANCCLEVKDGGIREFVGDFDYYLEKRKEELTPTKKKKKKDEAAEQKKVQSLDRMKEEEKLRKEKKRERKAFNASLGNKINKLKRKKEAFLLEGQATKRAIERPHKYRDAETIREHELRLKEIDQEIREIDLEINTLEEQLIQ